MSGRTIIVCGGRSFHDWRFIYDTLDAMHRDKPIGLLKHGDCPTGVDRIARDWARSRLIREQGFPADWKTHGRAAGPKRNSEMGNSGAELVLAFPGGTGTSGMCDIAKAIGLRVICVRPTP